MPMVTDVAHALVRAVSRLISTPVCVKEARRRQECRRGAHECVRHGEMTRLFPGAYRPLCGAGFFVHSPTQSRNVLYQSTEFWGFSIQCPSSGNSSNFAGTCCIFNAVNSCKPWLIGTRKSCSPWITSVGVRNSLTKFDGDHRSYISGFCHGIPPNSHAVNHSSSVSPPIDRKS